MPATGLKNNEDHLEQCLLCQANGLKRQVLPRVVNDPFGGSMTIDRVRYTCKECGYEGDMANENDAVYEKAKDVLAKKAVAKILNNFSEGRKVSNLNLERLLGLPMRTLARWKKDGASAGATVLLKYLETYPWLIEVAAKGFEPTFSRTILIENAEFAKRAPEPMINGLKMGALNFNPKSMGNVAANEELALAA